MRPQRSLSYKNRIQLDFVLAHAERDERPYLVIDILGKQFSALLDSGATRTIVGDEGWKTLSQMGLTLKRRSTICTVANGATVKVIGEISTPVKIQERVRVIDMMVVPQIPCQIILGTDFFRIMGVVPDLRTDTWVFSKDTPCSLISAIDPVMKGIQRIRLQTLIDELFQQVSDVELGRASGIEHTIVTNSPPIKQRYYPVSPAMQCILNKELDRMLALGVVEKSNSPWSSPVLLVPKKDNTYRFCVDYRKLNAVTVKDAYPLPFINNILDRLRDAQYLTSLDIKSAYWQIPIAEDSRHYTAFTVPNRGLFQFNRLAFGLSNAPAVWQRYIDHILGPELEPYVFVYLDDIIIVTPTFEEHLRVLSEVISRIHNSGLTLNREKCQFCREELRYLGYVVNRQGLLVDPDKVRAILDIPNPKNVTEVRRLVGMCSWYRRFVPNFSTVIAPLTDLLRKSRNFDWTQDCTEAWNVLKNYLTTAPVLTCPNFGYEFSIQCDSSNFGIGTVLTQEIDGKEHVICYLSRSLTSAERNYSTVEKECLAVLWSIEKLRPYIEGSHFKVITDHYSLLWLRKLDSPSGRLARWSVRLQQYDFEVIHRKGKLHVVPDALSRSVPQISSIQINPKTTDERHIQLIRRVKRYPDRYPDFRVQKGILMKHAPSYYILPAEEVERWKVVVPSDQRTEIIRAHHDVPTCGHPGVFKTMNRISQSYTWRHMRADVIHYINRCKVCLQTKSNNRPPIGLMGGHSKISKPWETLSIDILGPLPRTTRGYSYILAISDIFSKFVLTFPLRKATAKSVVDILESQVFLVFGVPRNIISDNGVQFRSREYSNLLKTYQVRSSYTSFYMPRSNPIERVNRILKTMLVSYVSGNQRKWDLILPKVTCAIRTAKHEVTGHTPYFINFGREMHISGIRGNPVQNPETDVPAEIDRDPEVLAQRTAGFAELYAEVRKRLQKAYEQSKTRYDLRRRKEEFQLEQLVWKRNFVLSDASRYFSSKLAPKYVGPYLVHQRLGTDSYVLRTCDGEVLPGTWHAEHLRAQPPD